jgi:hypothetical protein
MASVHSNMALIKRQPRTSASDRSARRARRKFLSVFPKGFYDPDYLELERDYKWAAHTEWNEHLFKSRFAALIKNGSFTEIAQQAVRIESKTNLLFSFEKMALRGAVRDPEGAKLFSQSLFKLLYGRGGLNSRFDQWITAIGHLPRRQTRVLTWPLATVFGFIARPDEHFFFKPTVTREAARGYSVELPYASRPSWPIYRSLLDFVDQVRADISNLRPRDMIDLQSFLWVQGSEEYPD